MKLSVAIVLAFVVVSCSNQESGFLVEKTTVTKEERPLIDSTEFAREELKDSARSLIQGKASEEVVVANFSKLLSTGKKEEAVLKNSRDYSAYTANIQLEVETLNSELTSIFNERIDLFLNLLNQSLAGKNISAVKIVIDQKNPKTAQNALNVLYSTLRSRGKELSLREQYLVFQLTEYLIEMYNSHNHDEIIPRETIAKFIQDQVKNQSDKPDLTFAKYQGVAGFLSDGELLNAMRPIFSRVTLGEHSSANELNMFRTIANFAIRKSITDIVKHPEEVKSFYKNLFFSSGKLLSHIPTKDSQVLAFFDAIDMTFKSTEKFLGKMASESSLSLREIADIQDEFVKYHYLPYIKNLEVKKDRILQMQEKIRVNYTSVNLQFVMISFFAEYEKGAHIALAMTNDGISSDYLKLKFDHSLKELESIEDTAIRNYLVQYHKATLGFEVLNLSQRFKGNMNDTDMYVLYESSKNSLKSVLKLRETEQAEIVMVNDSEEAYLTAGVYLGDLKVAKKIYLHPLTVIAPDKDTLTIEVTSLIGGRIDAGFESIDSSVVKNHSDPVRVSRGKSPTQSHQLVHQTKPCMSKRCGWDPELGAPEVTYTYQLSVVGAAAPDQELAGVSGLNGKKVVVSFYEASSFFTPIFSNGQRGFKGRQALNSPLCNSANEYSPFRGADHKYSCKDVECSKVQNEISYNKIFHVSAGISGNGGPGGAGGEISIFNKSGNFIHLGALSLGAPGGTPGDGALCAPPGEAARVGSRGESGSRGKVLISQ